MFLFLGLYLLIHLGTTIIRASYRAHKYHYYYLSKGVMAFPRCFMKRIVDLHTFLYSGLVGFGIILLSFIVQFIDQALLV